MTPADHRCGDEPCPALERDRARRVITALHEHSMRQVILARDGERAEVARLREALTDVSLALEEGDARLALLMAQQALEGGR